MRRSILLLIAIILCPLPICHAQTNAGTYADGNNPAGPQGPTTETQVWKIDPISGAVSIRIPISTIPHEGRGPTIPYILEYNSSATVVLSTDAIPPIDDVIAPVFPYLGNTAFFWSGPAYNGSENTPPGPWAVNGPAIEETNADVITGSPSAPGGTQKYTVTLPKLYIDENGNVHDMNVSYTNQNGNRQPCPSCPPDTLSAATYDGSALLTEFGSASIPGSGGVTYPNGSVAGDGYLQDSNGNLASETGTESAVSWVDSVGRMILTTTFLPSSQAYINSTSSTDTVTTTASDGTASTWIIQNETVPIGQFNMPHPTSQEITKYNPEYPPAVFQNSGGTVKEIQSITLPNGESYQFTYDPTYGTISKIVFPTGGYVRFVWGVRAIGTTTGFTSNGVSTIVATDAYLSTGTGAENHWHYKYQDLNISAQQLASTEYDPLGNITAYTAAPFIYNTIYEGGSPTFQETLRTISNSSGQLLRTITTTLNQEGVGIPGYGQPTQITTTYNDATPPVNQTVQYTYDQYDNVTEKDESDVYTGSTPVWLRKTITTYYWNVYPAYNSAHIVNKPYTVTVENGAGTPVAETQYDYDQSTPTPHGNLTSEKRCVQFSNNSCSVWLPPTLYTYDSYGERLTATDSKGNLTTYTYTNGYVTEITRPATNGVNHIEQYSYNPYTGQVASHIDENIQTTTYSDLDPSSGQPDPMNRIRQITLPATTDGTTGSTGSGYTRYTYSDTPGSVSVTKQDLMSISGQVVTNVSEYDGLGRLTRTILSSDPYGPVNVDTTYDVLGRISTVSNPYRSLNDPTYGITTSSYDGLNRTLSQTHSGDGSSLNWHYAGNVTDSYDENGHHWQRTTDGLGRLTEVLEPDNSNNPTIETDYGYDANDNLTSVDQKGGTTPLTRRFNFDGLSRLISSVNPESGTTTYTYDSDSNLLTKTDARGTTTTYSYDALNRMIGKAYSDTTYPVSYIYDTSSAPSATNTIGRLTDEKTTVQTVTMTERAIDQYDAMGRVLSERQCFVGGCGAATNYILTHSYDLSGDMVGSNNGLTGTGAAVFGYSFDPGDRLQSVTGSLNGAAPTTLFQAQQFGPIGLTQASYAIPAGGGSGAFSQTLTYDKRARLTGESNSVATPAPATLYSYSLGYYPNNAVENMTDSEMGGWTYTIDPLNRLSQGTAISGAYSGLTLTESYDNFGNRQSQAASGTSSMPITQPSPVTFVQKNNNQVDQWTYDAAGDVLSDGANMYEYDAEGRQTGTYNPQTGLIGYIYDAEGRRVMKVAVIDFGTPQAYTQVQKEYLLGLDDEQVSVLDGSGNWEWTNVYAGSKQLATYDNAGKTHFNLTDWLGTKRAQVSVAGAVEEQCLSLPYGDNLDCTGSETDDNHLHFTGKERDTESTNDYFNSRYYASNVASRFLTPDDGSDQDASNPQSWNLYSYVQNNPLGSVDPDGHDCVVPVFLAEKVEALNVSGGKCSGFGYYVPGHVTSATENQDKNSIDVGYTPYSQAQGGSGATEGVENVPGPDDSGFNASNTQIFVPADRVGNALGGALMAGLSVAMPEALVDAVPETASMLTGGARLGEIANILTKAGSSFGNTSIQVSSREVAEEAAKSWVGDGATPIAADHGAGPQVGWKSADGNKIARFTSAESKGYINLVDRETGSNLHVRWQ